MDLGEAYLSLKVTDYGLKNPIWGLCRRENCWLSGIHRIEGGKLGLCVPKLFDIILQIELLYYPVQLESQYKWQLWESEDLVRLWDPIFWFFLIMT